MSLTINESCFEIIGQPAEESLADQHELDLLNLYMAITDENMNACRFVPNDALVALDMAAFTRRQIGDGLGVPQLSVGRLALALVQPCSSAPIQ